MDKTILHCDMDGFFASVELLDHPHLKNVPMAVCGNPENRHGIILAKNQHAKKYGVSTAETLWQARKKCPMLEVVPPHMEKYKHYSILINKIYGKFTDIIEPFSIDESWLDVTPSLKLFGSGEKIADAIRATVRKDLGLTVSVGVSFNKIFAKMGSDYHKPDSTTLITRGNYKTLLWPMDVSKMFFVGSTTANKLKSAGIHTIADLASADKALLTALLGKHGGMLSDYARGLDTSPVLPDSERSKIKSVGNGTTFKRNLTNADDIKTAVTALSDTVASRLRKYEMKARGVKVDIKDPDFNTISRQKQLEKPTFLSREIFSAAMDIIISSWNVKKPIRLLTITGINLCEENAPTQLSIFDINSRDDKKGEKVERTMDSIRNRYGKEAITFGSTIKSDIGIDMDHNNKD